MDADTLFENHSIEEVKGIERKIRHDIEWKKEEMRDLVGERYRDLISAADTIKEMKRCAENVRNTLGSIDNHCQKLKAPKPVTNNPMQSLKDRNQASIYEVACQIKLLLAVPGRIWKYLDNADYLPATNLYLLAKHVQSCLQYDPQTGGQVLSRFPVIAKQWTAISYFKNVIIQICKESLMDYNQSHEQVAVSLSCIMLLEDKTPRQAFQDFLVARMYRVKGTSSVRVHISNAVKLIHNTVFQIAALFCEDRTDQIGEGKFLSRLLSSLLTTPILDQLQISEFTSLRRHLPKSITGFIPNLRVENVALAEDYLKASCNKWLQSNSHFWNFETDHADMTLYRFLCKRQLRCLENIRTTTREQLRYISSIKSLTAVREAVYEAYNQDDRMNHWSKTASHLLGTNLNIWKDEITPIYTERLQEICKEQFSTLLADTIQQLEKARELFTKQNRDNIDREVNLTQFVWCESSNDLPVFDKWIASSQKTFQDGSGLLMKAHGFTPLVQSLCKKLNGYLNTVLAEAAIYKDTGGISDDVKCLLDNHESLSDSVSECLTQECYLTINKLAEFSTTELKKLGRSSKGEENSNISWILFLARFYSALPCLCPDLKSCITVETAEQVKPLNISRSMSRSNANVSSVATFDPLWSETNDLLFSTSKTCYDAWKKQVVDEIETEFRIEFISDSLAGSLHNVTRWDELEIDEVTEQGSSVTSKISVPMQVTWCLQDKINHVCLYLNSIGSHCIPRELQLELVSSVIHQILRVYKDYMDNNRDLVTQAISLQILFDVWYLQGFALWRGSTQNTEIENLFTTLIEQAESKVDPFDLDVFSSHIHKHLSSTKSRNLVLYGAIADTERVLNTTNRSTLHASRHEQHNILPLHTASSTRFPLLPVVSESSRVGQTTNKPTSLPSTASAPQVLKSKDLQSAIKRESTFKQSASFYDRLGSGAISWFTGGTSK